MGPSVLVSVKSPFSRVSKQFAAVPGFLVRMLWEEAQTVAGDTSDLLFPFNYKAEL